MLRIGIFFLNGSLAAFSGESLLRFVSYKLELLDTQ